MTILVLLALAAANAECLTTSVESLELLATVKPIFDVTTRYAPLPSARPGLLADGRYRTSYGVLLDSECLAPLDEKDPPDPAAVGARIDATFRAMIEAVDRCGRRRLLSAVQSSFNFAMAHRPAIHCGRAPDCGGPKSGACASRQKNYIRIMDMPSRVEPAIYFHEFLHLADADNQNAVKHNRPQEYGSRERDEVYFWQDTCFNPELILARMRKGEEDACNRPLRSTEVKERYRYNPREAALHCELYSTYLEREKIFEKNVETFLTPEIFACGAHLDRNGCRDIAALNERLGAAKLTFRLPAPGQDPRAWVNSECPSLQGNESNSTERVAACLRRMTEKDSPINAALDTAVVVDQLDVNLVRDVRLEFERLRAKALFAGTLADTRQFPLIGSRGEAGTTLDAATTKCRKEPLLAGTSLCRSFMTSMQLPYAALLKYWE